MALLPLTKLIYTLHELHKHFKNRSFFMAHTVDLWVTKKQQKICE